MGNLTNSFNKVTEEGLVELLNSNLKNSVIIVQPFTQCSATIVFIESNLDYF